MRVLLLLFAAGLSNGQTAHDPSVVLGQARARLQAMAQSLEKYVCIETVDRSYYRRESLHQAPVVTEPALACSETAVNGGSRQLESTDRVRLEVSVAQGRELHSWPGATRFDARDVDQLIRNGPVSTGAFGGDLASVFGQPENAFEFKGQRSAKGKTVFEYGYRVPLEASRFAIKTPEAWRPAAYEGEFRLDPESLELERLTIRTKDLPAGASFCAAATTLEYQRVHIGSGDVLLPRQSELQIELKDGKEARNVTTFSNCREYQAESEIVFDVPSGAGSTAARSGSRARVALPVGLPVRLALEGSIDTDTASAGDPVSARVVQAVRRHGSTEELIPAGATVHGRIRRVEHHLLPEPYFLIAIALNRVEVQGNLSPFAARSEADAALAKKLNANLAVREVGIWFWGVGTFLFPTNRSRMTIPAGFESQWFTLAAGGR